MLTLEIKKLKTDIRLLKKQLALSEQERLSYQRVAERDFLTDVYNRHGFVRETERFLNEMKGERRHPGKRRSEIIKNVSIVFIDVDDLKKVNDVYGHKNGDLYIQSVARVLAKTVRAIDVVGRWGGDEFAIALVNAGEGEALSVSKKLKARINKIKLGKEIKDFTCSASFGFIAVDDEQRKRANYDLFDLIEKADKAMYEAKIKRGKGVIVSFSEIME